ncbi:MAG: hypothetical protein ACRDBG_04595 [Waterburya sp.]
MKFLNEAIGAADITALKAIVPPERRDGTIKIVKSPSGALPPTLYYYNAAANGAELLPTFVSPNDGIGRWIQLQQGLYYANTAPTLPPPTAGILWIAALSSPTRVSMWRSIANTTVGDWLPIPTIVSLTSNPTFNADYIGQRAFNSTDKSFWIAQDRAGNWISDDREELIFSTPITGNYTIVAEDRSTWKTITAAATITLPNVTTKLKVTLVRDLASGTVTIAPAAGVTLNAKGTSFATNKGVVELFSLGTGVWYARGDLS